MDAELFEAEEVEVDVELDPESFDDVDDVDPESDEPELDEPEEPPESEDDFFSLVPPASLLGESLLEPEDRESFR